MDNSDFDRQVVSLRQQIDALQQQIREEKTDLHRAEATLQARARQQAVVAELGQQALLGIELSTLMDEAVTRLAQTLNVEYCKVLELLPGGDALLLRAGVGWQPGLVGEATIGTDRNSQAGYTLLSSEPVIVEDLNTETRFNGPALLHDHGVVSGMSVIIPGREHPFGVLGIHTTRRIVFSTDDIHFLQSVAHVLASSIERKQREEALQQSRDQLAVILHGIKEGIAVQEPGGNLIYANTTAAQMIGYPTVQALIETPLAALTQKFEVMDESGRPFPLEQLPGRLALQGQQPKELLLRFRVKGSEEERWSVVNARPAFDERGQVQFAVNIFHDVTERILLYQAERKAREKAEETAERITALQRVTAALSAVLTPEEVAQLVVEQGIAALGARAGVILLLSKDNNTLELIHAVGYAPELIGQWQNFSVDTHTPIADAVRHGAPVIVESPQALSDRYPHLVTQVNSVHKAWVGIPLMIEQQILGAMGLSFVQSRAFGEDDRAFMLALSRQCAQAFERARLYEIEQSARAEIEAARQRLEFLAEASGFLSASLDYEETLSQVARLAVPEIADWCGVDVLQGDGTVERVAVAHVDPAKVELAYDLQRHYPTVPDAAEGLSYVLRTGQPELYLSISDDALVTFARDERHLDILRRLQLHSVMIIPLKARERVLGALTLATAESGRRFSDDDIALAEELAYRAALAVDNARLYREAGRLNEELEQRINERTAALQHINEQLEAEITERRQAEERIRQQAARTASLVRTAARLNAQLDLDAVLHAVCEEAAHALDVPIVTLSLYDPESNALVPAHALGMLPEFEAKLEPLPREVYEAYTQKMGHLVVIPDVQLLTDLPNATLYADHNIRTTVSVSMLRQGQLIGRLNIGSIGEVRNFSDNELALLQGLADQAAQAIVNAHEVTERRRAEETLRKSEMRLAEAQKIAHLGSWEWNIATNAVTWSDETYRIFGFEPGAFDITYDNFLELIHPDDRDYTHEVIQESYRTHKPYNFYQRIVRPDGAVRVNQARGEVVLDDAGNVVAMVGTGQDVTELKEAEAQLERHAQQLEAVSQMGLAVTATLELSAVLKRVLDQVSPLLPAEGIWVLLLEGDELIFAATSGPGAAGLDGRRIPMTAGIAGEVIRSGRPIWIDDARDDLLFQVNQRMNDYQVQTLLAVPLKLHGHIIGVMEAVHSQPETFGSQDLQLLEATASWTAIAIGNARQHEQIRKRLQESESLAAINRALSETLDQKRILQRIVHAARQIISTAAGAVIHLFDEETQSLYPAASVGLDDLNSAGYKIGMGEDIAGRVIAQGAVINMSDIQQEPLSLPAHQANQIRSLLVAPIKSSTRQLGTISVFSPQPGIFSADDERVLTALGVQAALTIQNTRLYEALGEEKGRLELLYSLSHNLTTSLNPRTVAARALDLTMRALGAFRGEIFVLHPDGSHLALAALSGYGAGAQALIDRHTMLPLAKGLVGRVAHTRVAVAVPDVRCNDYWLPWPGLEDEEVCSVAAVPLLAGDALVGVLSLLSEKEGFFNEEHLPLLQAVATPVALSLQNARLYEAEHRARQVADTLRAANIALSGTLDLDVILEMMLDHVGQLVSYDTANAMLLDGEYLHMRALRGYEKWTRPEAAQKVVFNIETTPHLYEVVSRQRSIIIADTAEYAGWQSREGIDHVHNWMGVPLRTRGQVVGVFSLDKAEPNYFTEVHLQLVEALAAQATIAIQNAHLFEQVRAGRERLRQLTNEVVSAQEEERQRVSRELHDEAGQALTALKISLDLTKTRLPAELESVQQSIAEAMELTDETMDRIRMLAQNLRPPALDTLGLNATLEGLSREFAHRTGLSITYKGSGLPPLSEAATISLYRFVQEALTNVAKHAHADTVKIIVDYDDTLASISISDNGRGFRVQEQGPVPLRPGGLGLMGMRERFEMLSGRLEITSQPGEGTHLTAYVPLA